MKVIVDPRVELFGTIFRLAGNPEYTVNKLPCYVNDVEDYFSPFRDHDVVQFARQLRETQGISYNAPMALAVCVIDAYSLQEKISLQPLPEEIDKRWTTESARTFLEKARAFVEESNFEMFIETHHKIYDIAVQRILGVLQKHKVYDWFDSFFGENPGASFILIIGMQNGGGSYGARLRHEDGKEEFYSILGVWKTDIKGLPVFDRGVLSTIVHEFCHSYVNPLVMNHVTELEEAGTKIYGFVENDMRKQAYTNWQIMVCEYLVRACVIRYIYTTYGAKAAERTIEREIENRFVGIEGLSDLLKEYETQRDRYLTMDSFFSQIVSFFDDYSKQVEEVIKKFEKPTI